MSVFKLLVKIMRVEERENWLKAQGKRILIYLTNNLFSALKLLVRKEGFWNQ